MGRDASIDADGDFIGGDLLDWQRTLVQPAVKAGAGADGNRSGTFNGGDLVVWRTQFGGSQGAAANAMMPEPTTLALAAFVLLIVPTSRQRSR